MWAFQREKLLHAIIFFTKETKACHKLKLFKLLYFLDFEMYGATGRSATGLHYFAWPMGPVPRDLFQELKSPPPDMRKALALKEASESDPDFTDKRLTILPRLDFDEKYFSKRELDAMSRLALIYRDATSAQMSEVSHLPGQPWHHVYEVQKHRQQEIPYSLALSSKAGSPNKEQVEQIEEEAREAAAFFK